MWTGVGASVADQPTANHRFGLPLVPALLDQDVVVRGWYRRSPAPLLELRELVPAEGRRVRGFQWVAVYQLSALLAVAGATAWVLVGFLGCRAGSPPAWFSADNPGLAGRPGDSPGRGGRHPVDVVHTFESLGRCRAPAVGVAR